ncbi:hypothetical protein ACFWPU_00955 [Streptomyces sp. NPDC058471]|uniref:hypothetical protein n=1 Tax=Streptomyces sp. NPDC058471 TaxID=3346516 RepID=UPI00364BEF78
MKFHEGESVRVTGAPGYTDFDARIWNGGQALPAVDARGDLAVVLDEADEPHVIPVKHIEERS